MIWLLAILLMVGAEAVAQNRGGGERRPMPTAEEMAERKTGKMTEKLGLSPEQAARVGELNRQQAERRRAHRETMRQEQEAHQAALREVLTPEQYARWEQISQRRGRGQSPEMGQDSCCQRREGHRRGGCCHKPHHRGPRQGAPRTR